MRIVQIVPFIGPGRGVAGVAWALDQEFRAAGHEVEVFTYATARGPTARAPRHGVTERLAQIWRIWWFSTIGTRRAKRFLAARPDAVSICHNNVMTGDVFVDHGVMSATMKAAGDSSWRRWGNPSQWFVHLRDMRRYRGTAHRAIVVPTEAEAEVLRRVYGDVRAPITVIPHGVDLRRFRPPTPYQRAAAREALGLDGEHRVALFIGHEFERKGLGIAIEALRTATTVLLLVVGGTRAGIDRARQIAAAHGVADRVHFAGPQQNLSRFLAAADFLILPSSYESSGLVVLEALASGLPVVSTPVGVAADLIAEGVNGLLCPRDPVRIAEAMERMAMGDREQRMDSSRASVEHLSWASAAARYIDLLERLQAERRVSA